MASLGFCDFIGTHGVVRDNTSFVLAVFYCYLNMSYSIDVAKALTLRNSIEIANKVGLYATRGGNKCPWCCVVNNLVTNVDNSMREIGIIIVDI